MLPEEAKVGEDLAAGAAEAQSKAPSENVFSSHSKSNKAGEDLCAVGAEAQSELRSEHAMRMLALSTLATSTCQVLAVHPLHPRMIDDSEIFTTTG